MRYEAPDACPGQSEFVEQVRARMRVDGTRAPTDSELRVSVAERGAGIHGSLEIKRGATSTQRSVDAASCAEVVEALALIAALALRDQDAPAAEQRVRAKPRLRKADKSERGRRESAAERDARTSADPLSTSLPDGQSRGAKARPQAGDARTSADPLSASLPDGQSRDAKARPQAGDARTSADPLSASPPDGQSRDATSADEGARQPNAAELAATSTRVGGGARQRAAARAGSTAARDAASSEPELAGRSATWGFSGSFGATLLLFSGLAPAMQPGLQLRAAWVLRSEEVAWSLQLAARLARRVRVAAGSGDAYFGFVGGAVRVCGARTLGRFGLGGCAVAEPGVFSTGSDNTLNSRSHSRLWLAAGAAGELHARVAGWLVVFGGAELLTPVRRDRVLLGQDTLYRVPVLGLRLQLGLEVPFG